MRSIKRSAYLRSDSQDIARIADECREFTGRKSKHG